MTFFIFGIVLAELAILLPILIVTAWRKMPEKRRSFVGRYRDAFAKWWHGPFRGPPSIDATAREEGFPTGPAEPRELVRLFKHPLLRRIYDWIKE